MPSMLRAFVGPANVDFNVGDQIRRVGHDKRSYLFKRPRIWTSSVLHSVCSNPVLGFTNHGDAVDVLVQRWEFSFSSVICRELFGACSSQTVVGKPPAVQREILLEGAVHLFLSPSNATNGRSRIQPRVQQCPDLIRAGSESAGIQKQMPELCSNGKSKHQRRYLIYRTICLADTTAKLKFAGIFDAKATNAQMVTLGKAGLSPEAQE